MPTARPIVALMLAASSGCATPLVEARCVAPDGLGDPRTIAEVVDLVNGLPEPVDAPCVVQALDRPLGLAASWGTISAQPAAGDDPRIFLFVGDLVLSVVASGDGRDLLELGEYATLTTSLKGELRLPATPPVADDAPYGHLAYSDELTTCGLCHYAETSSELAEFPNARVSIAFRPANSDLVPFDDVTARYEACDPAQDPARCALYDAIFAWGQVLPRQFPDEMPTFFDD